MNLDRLLNGAMYVGVVGGGAVASQVNNVPISTLTPSVLLGIGILLMLTGKIVHVSALERERETTNKFETAYHNEAEARANNDKQVSELLDYAKATDLFIKSLAKDKQQGGE